MDLRALAFSALIASGGFAASHADELSPAASRIAALDRTIMVREGSHGKRYGENEIDPLLWSDSDYFLSGESRRRLLVALTEVTNLPDAEVQRCAPAQRALVQNRVWTVFDHVWQDTNDVWKRTANAGLDRELPHARAGHEQARAGLT
jgi:hypothetical protein